MALTAIPPRQWASPSSRSTLLKHFDCRSVGSADFGEHAAHFLSEAGVGRGGVDDMQDEVRFGNLFKRCLEGVHEGHRQFADEAHGVGHNDLCPRAHLPTPHGGIERSEHLVGGVNAVGGEGVEQRGLPGVGIARQRHRGDARPIAPPPALGTLAMDALEPVAHVAHPAGQHALVHFELRFASAAQVDATLLPVEVGPAADESRLGVR